MATKGAHVFRINIADYAREWLQELRIMQYQPSLYTLNFDYDTLNEPVDEASPPEAFISELDEPEPQESVKRLPTASWELVRKLSQQLAVTVSGSNAKKPLNFSKCLEDVYMRETTPRPPQKQGAAPGAHSRSCARAPIPSTDKAPSRPKRKLRSSDSDSDLNDDESNGDEVGNTGSNLESTSKDAQPPRKKGRPADESNGDEAATESAPKEAPRSGTPVPAETAEGTLPAYESSPDASRQDVDLPPLDDGNDDNQGKLDTALPDWTRQVPQALALNTQPGVVDSPKIGVWHLPSQMVRPLFLSVLTLSNISLVSKQDHFVWVTLRATGLPNLLSDDDV